MRVSCESPKGSSTQSIPAQARGKCDKEEAFLPRLRVRSWVRSEPTFLSCLLGVHILLNPQPDHSCPPTFPFSPSIWPLTGDMGTLVMKGTHKDKSFKPKEAELFLHSLQLHCGTHSWMKGRRLKSQVGFNRPSPTCSQFSRSRTASQDYEAGAENRLHKRNEHPVYTWTVSPFLWPSFSTSRDQITELDGLTLSFLSSETLIQAHLSSLKTATDHLNTGQAGKWATNSKLKNQLKYSQWTLELIWKSTLYLSIAENFHLIYLRNINAPISSVSLGKNHLIISTLCSYRREGENYENTCDTFGCAQLPKIS